MPDADPISAIAKAVRSARHVVVLTGAGVSAESGTPTFRDAMTGLWASFNPQELATPEAFEKNPELVTRWYDQRRIGCMACAPNPGHLALARLEEQLTARGGRFTLLTQNVDRLHHRAGSINVVELHGTIMVWRCTRTGREFTPPAEPMTEFPPRSPAGGLLRPNVVWFGEMLPESALAAAFEALQDCDLFLSIGTSSVVHPAASFIHIAKSAGAATGEINPESTPITPLVDFAARGKSGELLPLILDRCGPQAPAGEGR
ncbi:MAG: NAD-dependent protein deacylase Sir2 [Phycisphaerales bacterium]|nr:NAD-dependent protein deacylase Sir2 [Phycisphaerales bacterium]MCK6476951.1 NAD-dependent deacylase [Phycisphaerales bacterium]